MYINICTQVFIQQHQQSHWMQPCINRAIINYPINESQFSDLSSAQKIWELIFLDSACQN